MRHDINWRGPLIQVFELSVKESVFMFLFVCSFFFGLFVCFFSFAFCFVLLFFILRIEKRRSGTWRREVNYDISKVN